MVRLGLPTFIPYRLDALYLLLPKGLAIDATLEARRPRSSPARRAAPLPPHWLRRHASRTGSGMGVGSIESVVSRTNCDNVLRVTGKGEQVDGVVQRHLQRDTCDRAWRGAHRVL